MNKNELKAKLENMRVSLKSEFGEIRNLVVPGSLEKDIFPNDELSIEIVANDDLQSREQYDFLFENSIIHNNNKNLRILNMGSGWGILSRYVRRKNRDIEITNLDISKNILDSSRRISGKIDPKLNDGVIFQLGDATQMNLPNEHFDEIVSLGTLRYIPRDRFQNLIKEMLRVTKHGGKIVTSEIDDPSIPALEQNLNNMGIQFKHEEKLVTSFRLMAFYFYYFMYLGKNINNVKRVEQLLGLTFSEFRNLVDRISTNENKTPIKILIELVECDKQRMGKVTFIKN